MTQGQALVWFICTSVFVVLLLAGGVFEATHSYDVPQHPRKRRLRHH